MSKKRILISAACGLTALVVALVLYAYYDFTHNFRLPLTSQQISNAEIAFKGAMGQAIFSGQQLKPETVCDVCVRPDGNQRQGLIEAYQKDPQKFKRYANMLDTAVKAKQVGDVVLHEGGSHPPSTSELLPMDANLKVDAWGSPFCIIPAAGRVAVVSGGPSRLMLFR